MLIESGQDWRHRYEKIRLLNRCTRIVELGFYSRAVTNDLLRNLLFSLLFFVLDSFLILLLFGLLGDKGLQEACVAVPVKLAHHVDFLLFFSFLL